MVCEYHSLRLRRKALPSLFLDCLRGTVWARRLAEICEYHGLRLSSLVHLPRVSPLAASIGSISVAQSVSGGLLGLGLCPNMSSYLTQNQIDFYSQLSCTFSWLWQGFDSPEV